MEWGFINWIGQQVLGLENYQLAIMGFSFWGFRWYRTEIKEAKKEGNKKFIKLIESEIDMKLSFVQSDAYVDMEMRVHDLADKGATSVVVRSASNDDVPAPFGTFKDGYYKHLKDVASDVIQPFLLTMLIEDFDRYIGEDASKYIVDGSHNLGQLFRSSLGRKVGISEISKCVEDDVLTDKYFTDTFGSLIDYAVATRKKLNI